jgi:hypothetical protein
MLKQKEEKEKFYIKRISKAKKFADTSLAD